MTGGAAPPVSQPVSRRPGERVARCPGSGRSSGNRRAIGCRAPRVLPGGRVQRGSCHRSGLRWGSMTAVSPQICWSAPKDRYERVCALSHEDQLPARPESSAAGMVPAYSGSRPGGGVNIVNVAVMAPILGADLSYVTDVDARVRALDANQATGDSRHGLPPDRVNDILAVAAVLLVGYPVAGRLAGRAPRLAWAHHTQAGVSNLAGSDLWTSPVPLPTSRGVVGATA